MFRILGTIVLGTSAFALLALAGCTYHDYDGDYAYRYQRPGVHYRSYDPAPSRVVIREPRRRDHHEESFWDKLFGSDDDDRHERGRRGERRDGGRRGEWRDGGRRHR